MNLKGKLLCRTRKMLLVSVSVSVGSTCQNVDLVVAVSHLKSRERGCVTS